MEEKNPVGRPSQFDEALKEKLLELAANGYTDEQMAEVVGVHVNTIGYWKNKNKEFKWSLKEAKLIADELVEASLFRRAVGYSHKELKVFHHEGSIATYEVLKHYPPDPVSCIFWLKNRQPKLWREKVEHGFDNENPPKLIIVSSEADDFK